MTPLPSPLSQVGIGLGSSISGAAHESCARFKVDSSRCSSCVIGFLVTLLCYPLHLPSFILFVDTDLFLRGRPRVLLVACRHAMLCINVVIFVELSLGKTV